MTTAEIENSVEDDLRYYGKVLADEADMLEVGGYFEGQYSFCVVGEYIFLLVLGEDEDGLITDAQALETVPDYDVPEDFESQQKLLRGLLNRHRLSHPGERVILTYERSIVTSSEITAFD